MKLKDFGGQPYKPGVKVKLLNSSLHLSASSTSPLAVLSANRDCLCSTDPGLCSYSGKHYFLLSLPCPMSGPKEPEQTANCGAYSHTKAHAGILAPLSSSPCPNRLQLMGFSFPYSPSTSAMPSLGPFDPLALPTLLSPLIAWFSLLVTSSLLSLPALASSGCLWLYSPLQPQQMPSPRPVMSSFYTPSYETCKGRR